MSRRWLLVLGSACSLLFGLLGASPVSAGCGWPSCNPAQLSGSDAQIITPPGGKQGDITVSFTSSDPYRVPETRVTFAGSSKAQWLGSVPFNATTVTLIDSWHVDAIAPSVGYPSGIGITGSGGDASWSDPNNNTWHVTHNFSGIQFNAIDIVGISETATGRFKFGTTSWSISAHDDCFV